MFPSSINNSSSSDPTSTDPAPRAFPRSRSNSGLINAGALALGRRRSISTTLDYLPIDAPPSLLAQSEILARLASGPTFLPTSLAHLISAVSVCSRVSIRSAALFIEAILESIRQATLTGLGLTRRALISAVASARTLHYVARGLDWEGKNDEGVKEHGLYLGMLDRYTNVGIYVINHTFTLAELFSLAGLSLTMSTSSLAFATAEESVRLLDSLLGSGETSRALSAIIALVRTEMTEDPNFTIVDKGVISTLTLLTKTLTAFVCLQAATSKRTARETSMRVVYDCTVVTEADDSLLNFVPSFPTAMSGVPETEPFTSATPHTTTAEDTTTVRERRRSRAPSFEAAAHDVEHFLDSTSTSPRRERSRQNSMVYDDGIQREEMEEETEIIEELTELCGMSENDELGDGGNLTPNREVDQAIANLPAEVNAALQELEGRSGGQRIVTSSAGSHYEINVTETTTTTTRTVRTTGSTSSSNQGTASVDRPNSLSKRSKTRSRPSSSSIFHMSAPLDLDIEEADAFMGGSDQDPSFDVRADEWIDVARAPPNSKEESSSSADSSRRSSHYNNDVAMAPEASTDLITPDHRAAASAGSSLQVVFRTMTRKFTQRKRTIRRVDGDAPPLIESPLSTPSSSGESTPRLRRVADHGSENQSDGFDFSSSASASSPNPQGKATGGRILKAFNKALRRDSSGENAEESYFTSKPGPNSRPASSRNSTASTTVASSQPSKVLTPTTPPPPPRTPGFGPFTPIKESRPSSASLASSRRPSMTDLAMSRRSSVTPLDPFATASPDQSSFLHNSSAHLPRLRRAESSLSIVTTCKHSQTTPTEESEPKAANFPRQHLVANLQRFMRYSSAAYGQAFLRILGLGKSRGLDFSFPNTTSNANNHAFAHHVGIPVADILLDSYTTPGGGIFDNHRISPIVTYLVVDHEMKAVVLSCRGSLGLSDVLVDLVCSYEQIHVPDGDPMASYQVHAGMWHSATRLQRGLVHQTIREALEQYPDYGLVLTGHSLGGGVSSLLSLLWSTPSHVFKRNRRATDESKYPPIFTPFVTSYASGLPAGRPIHCYVFGPPCVASPDLGRYCRGLVTSTTHNNDVVPTLSIGTLRDLKTMAMNLHQDAGMGTTREIIGRVCGIYQRKIASATSNRLYRALPGIGGSTEAEQPSLYDVSDEVRTVALTKAELSAGRGENRALDPAYCDPTLQEDETPEDLAVNDYLWSVMRTLRADNDNDKLFPPGNVYIIENYTVFISTETRPGQNARREGRRILLRAVDQVEKRFAEPVFGKTLFMDHSPTGYEENVDLLARAVLG